MDASSGSQFQKPENQNSTRVKRYLVIGQNQEIISPTQRHPRSQRRLRLDRLDFSIGESKFNRAQLLTFGRAVSDVQHCDLLTPVNLAK